MERGDDIAKVDRTLIGMDEEHCERDFILDSIKNRKTMEAGKSKGNVVTSIILFSSHVHLFACILFNSTPALFRLLVPRTVETEQIKHVEKLFEIYYL